MKWTFSMTLAMIVMAASLAVGQQPYYAPSNYHVPAMAPTNQATWPPQVTSQQAAYGGMTPVPGYSTAQAPLGVQTRPTPHRTTNVVAQPSGPQQTAATPAWLVPPNGSYPQLQPPGIASSSSFPQTIPSGNQQIATAARLPNPQAYGRSPQLEATWNRPFGMANVQVQPASNWTNNAAPSFQFANTNAAGTDPVQAQPTHVEPPIDKGGFDTSCYASCGFWEASIDLLALRRSGLHPYGLITPTAVGSPTLNVADLDFDFSLGIQASLARQTAGGLSIQARGLWIDEWSDSRRLDGNLALNGPGFQLGVAPGEFDVRYNSKLVGAELNFGDFLCDHCGWFWGIRWLRFEDHLLVDELDLPVAGALDMEARNDLIGIQAGRFFRIADVGNFRSRLFAKGGVYYNFIDNSVRSSFLGPPIQDTDYDVSFLGEFGIDAAYCINECLRVRVAYEIIGVSQMATSTDQIAASDLSTGIAGINTNGMFFDGGYVGIEFVR